MPTAFQTVRVTSPPKSSESVTKAGTAPVNCTGTESTDNSPSDGATTTIVIIVVAAVIILVVIVVGVVILVVVFRAKKKQQSLNVITQTQNVEKLKWDGNTEIEASSSANLPALQKYKKSTTCA